MNELCQALTAAAERIYATGYYDKLSAAYPKRIAEVNAELDANWTVAGIQTWEDRMMKGLNKVKGAMR